MPGSITSATATCKSCQALSCGHSCSALLIRLIGLRPEPLEDQQGFIIRQLEKHGYESLGHFRQSELWDGTKRTAKEQLGYVCFGCGSTERLHLHHKTYERLGEELLDDVCWLCTTCHLAVHRCSPTVERSYFRISMTLDRFTRLNALARELGYKRWSGLLDRWMDYTVKNPDLFRKR